MNATRLTVILLTITLTGEGFAASKRDAWAPYAQAPLIWETLSEWQRTPESSPMTGEAAGTNQVLVEPGSGVWFLLDENAVLRLDQMAPAEAANLRVMQSDPLGLYYPLPMVQAVSGRSLISRRPMVADRLIWIHNHSDTPVNPILMKGTRAAPNPLPRWADLKPDHLETTLIYQSPQADWQPFHALPESGVRFSLEGPQVLELTLRQSLTDGPLPRRDFIDVKLGESQSRRYALHFRPDRDHRFEHGDQYSTLSLSERVYLNIPEESVEIEFMPSFRGWFKVRRIADHVLLDDSMPWQVSDRDLAKSLISGQTQEQNRVAQFLAEQSYAEPMKNEFTLWGEPSVIDGPRYHYFRDLWPDNAVQAESAEFMTARFITPETDLDTYLTPMAPSSPLRDADTFVRLDAADRLHTFSVPGTSPKGELKVRLVSAEPGTQITIRTGDLSHTLLYRPDLRLKPLTALDREDSLAIATGRAANPLLVSEARLGLQTGAGLIEVSADRPGVSLSLQVEERSTPQMVPTELVGYAKSQDPSFVAESWINDIRPTSVDASHWQDSSLLRHWLQGRSASFADDLSPPMYKLANASMRLAQLEKLIDQGEKGLATNLAKGALVYSSDEGQTQSIEEQALRHRAYAFLVENYKSAASSFGLQTLLANQYLATRDPEIAIQLVEQLYVEGFLKESLRLSLGIEQQRLTPTYRDRLHHLNRSAGRATDWLAVTDFLTSGSSAATHDEQALPPVWVNAGELISSRRITRQVWNPKLERLFTRHQAGPDIPLMLTVNGPAKLRLSVNLLHRSRAESMDDWLDLTHNGQVHRIPILDSQVHGRLRLEGSPKTDVGSQDFITLALSEGHHELEIQTRSQPALVGVERLVADYTTSDRAISSALKCNAFKEQYDQSVGIRDGDVIASTANGWQQVAPAAETIARLCARLHSSSEPVSVSVGTLLSLEPAAALQTHTPVSEYSSQTLIESRLAGILGTADFHEQPELIAEANNLGALLPGNPRVEKLLANINERQFWEQEELITRSAGLVGFESDGWLPESDFLETRYPLLGQPPGDGERLLFGRNSRGIQLNPQRTTQYRLQLRLDRPAYQKIPPITVIVSENDRRLRRIELSPSDPIRSLPFSLDPGVHKLTLKLDNATSRHWVFARLELRDSEHANTWTTAFESGQRYYHLVTRADPLTLYLDQPAWLRVESYDGDNWHSQYFYRPESGYKSFTLSVLKGQYVRVYSLRHKPKRKLLGVPQADVPDVTTNNTPEVPQVSNADVALVYDAFTAQSDDSGTHGAFAAFRQRPDFDSADREREKFLEAGYRYRRLYENQRLHWQGEGFARLHEDTAIQVVGSRHWLTWRPDRRHWRLGAMLNGHWQTDSDTSTSGSSAYVSAYAQGHFYIGDALDIRHRVTFFHHWLSEQQTGTNAAYDRDVFSSYKQDHRRGLDLQESLVYSPYNDAELSAIFSARSNENLNPSDPDRFSLGLSWQQYWHQVRLQAGIETRWLQADDDRRQARSQTLVEGNASWFTWQAGGQRWETGVGFGYDVDTDELRFTVSLEWDRPGARRLRDFRPESLSFSAREHAVANHRVQHNYLNYIEHEE
ncbi:hypothetical protein [Marinobacter caseinilyticus]|uniref:hypothetical protein n=1 Tax=Marinobacter caseinilyticus TaxID=2692195 RepID=UPI001408ECF7|nr:hypothetical protein [Marinobacter caseinilyticus]